MNKPQDLTGKKFGKLIVIKFEKKENNKRMWLCKCDCGNIILVDSSHLLEGYKKSCGCIFHNQSKTRLYNIWIAMKRRCYSFNYTYYKNYGGRGIKVCDEWKNDFMSFYNWAMANGYRDDLTIDRIDVNGNYEPNNCRWSTKKEQANNRRSNIIFEYNGEKNNLMYFIKKYNLNSKTTYSRIRRGWNIKETIEKPIK